MATLTSAQKADAMEAAAPAGGRMTLERDMSSMDMQLQPPPSRGGCRGRLVVVATILGICALAAVVGIAIFVTDRKSQSIKVPDTFTAEFRVKDVHEIHPFTYTGRLAKSTDADGEWVVELEVENIDPVTNDRHVMTIIDDTAYFSHYPTETATTPDRTWCYDPKRVPPINDIDDVLKAAVVVPSDAVLATPVEGACHNADGDKFAMTWGEDSNGLSVNDYYYCLTVDGAHQLIGNEFVATMFNVDDSPAQTGLGLSVPLNLTTGEPLQCDPLPRDVSALGNWEETRRRLGAPDLPLRKGTPKRRKLPGGGTECWFVHGTGPTSDATSEPGSYSDYWGDVENWVGNDCDDVKFLKRDYTTKSWDDHSLATDFCNTVGNMDNKIIFSHGAGSLIVANAFYSNYCAKASSTRWYAIGTPWLGTPVADNIGTLCSTYSSILSNLDDAIGLCDGSSGTTGINALATNYVSLSGTTFAQLSAFAASTPSNGGLDGALCGGLSSGLSTGDGDELSKLDEAITFGGFNDGFSNTVQCSNSVSLDVGANHDFYGAGLNYLDLTCRYGNAFFDVFKLSSPCTWYNHVTS